MSRTLPLLGSASHEESSEAVLGQLDPPAATSNLTPFAPFLTPSAALLNPQHFDFGPERRGSTSGLSMLEQILNPDGRCLLYKTRKPGWAADRFFF